MLRSAGLFAAPLLLFACVGSAGLTDGGERSGDLYDDGDLGPEGGADMLALDASGTEVDAHAPPPTDPRIRARPYQSYVPSSYDPSRPAPLVVALHGYTSSGSQLEDYFHFKALADAKGFLYAFPDGTKDFLGLRFWNATDACCNYGSNVDDVAYLEAVIADMSGRYDVDPRRVFVVGHSNGAFMAHRMACDRAGRVAAIVALAGDNWKDVSKCKPSEPVAVLQIHGDDDPVIHYDGGQNVGLQPYPSALASMTSWAQLDACAATAQTGFPSVDVDSSVSGAETTVARWSGCRPGGAAELWTMHGSGHQPSLTAGFGELVWGFLSAHPKP